MISVCMATYNGADYLAEQVESILAQLRPGDELLVSDDGSTDSTLSILQSYGDRVRVVGTGRVGGVVPNFERVLKAASGDVIMLSDQDDVWLPGRADRICQELVSADLVLTNAILVDAALRPVGRKLFDFLPPSTGVIKNLWRNSFVGCCIGFRRELLRGTFPFPTNTPWHDWLIGLLACSGRRVRIVETPFLLFRRHDNNASATGKPSRSSLLRRLVLRLRIVRALGVCLWRGRLRGAVQ